MELSLYLCNTRTPKPLNDAQIGGRFIFVPMSIQFDKTYTLPFEIIAILKGKGLNIAENITNCINHLQRAAGYDGFDYAATIGENDYNLSVSSYVAAENMRPQTDIKKVNEHICRIMAHVNELRAEIDKIIVGLKQEDEQ